MSNERSLTTCYDIILLRLLPQEERQQMILGNAGHCCAMHETCYLSSERMTETLFFTAFAENVVRSDALPCFGFTFPERELYFFCLSRENNATSLVQGLGLMRLARSQTYQVLFLRTLLVYYRATLVTTVCLVGRL